MSEIDDSDDGHPPQTMISGTIDNRKPVQQFEYFAGPEQEMELIRKDNQSNKAERYEKAEYYIAPKQDMEMIRNAYQSDYFKMEPSQVIKILPKCCEFDDQVNLLSEAYHLVYGGPNNLLYKSTNLIDIKTPLKNNNVLHLAASHGNDNIVTLLTERAPKLLFEFNKNRDSVLHVAARGGHISIVKKLLATYTNIERIDIKKAWLDYMGNLEDPKDYDYVKNMEDLLNFVKKENVQGNSMFHEAMLCDKKSRSIGGGEDNIFKVCEIYKTKDRFGRSLSEFCFEYAFEIVNHEMKSVLYLGVWNGDKDVVELILRNYLKNDDDNDDYDMPKGLSPVVAAIMKCNQEMISIILQNKPKWIHLMDNHKRLPLHYATSLGFIEGVNFLLSICKCCTIKMDRYGFFPIHLASYGGHVEIVKKLLEYCPDPSEILDDNQQNILHIASKYGRHEVVKYILQSQIREHHKLINQKDINGDTPLHLASRACHPTTVYYLTRNEKVELDLVNIIHKTALDVASEVYEVDKSSLRQHLTWTALKSAGAKKGLGKVPIRNEASGEGEESKTKQNNENNSEIYKDRIENLTIVSTLIVTASVAACLAVPGEADGKANNLNHAMFQAFIIFITVSLFSSISSTVILFWGTLGLTETSIFTLQLVMPLLGVALISLSLAFMAGLYTVISELSWLSNVFLIMTVIFIVTVILLYILLFLPSSSTSKLLRFISHYPFLFWASRTESKTVKPSKVSIL